MTMDTPALREALKRRYGEHLRNRPAYKLEGFLIEEVLSPDRHRSADALYVYTSSKDRGKIVGYELKVSRADLLAELADPTKFDSWAQYCTEWWLLVADESIIEGLEDRIPESWGIAVPPKNARRTMFTVIRPAGVRQVSATTLGFAAIVSKVFYNIMLPHRDATEQLERLSVRHRELLVELQETKKPEYEVPYTYERYLKLKDLLVDFPWLTDKEIIEYVKRFENLQDSERDLERRARRIAATFEGIAEQQQTIETLFNPPEGDE